MVIVVIVVIVVVAVVVVVSSEACHVPPEVIWAVALVAVEWRPVRWGGSTAILSLSQLYRVSRHRQTVLQPTLGTMSVISQSGHGGEFVCPILSNCGETLADPALLLVIQSAQVCSPARPQK